MRKAIFSGVAALLVAGCAPGGLGGVGPISEVTVDGVPTLVRQLRAASNTYVAREVDLTGGWIDPNDYVRNVKAIEAVTGCKVIAESVVNSGLVTNAAVDC